MTRHELAAAGKTAKEIAEIEGTNREAIRKWASRAGIKLAPDALGPGCADWQMCMDAGMSSAQAAIALGRSVSAAGQFARRTGQRWSPLPSVRGAILEQLATMPRSMRDDFYLLVNSGETPDDALATVTRPRVKVPLRIPREMAVDMLARYKHSAHNVSQDVI